MGQHQSLKTPNQMFLFLELSKRSCETMAIQKSVFEYADPHKFGCLCSLTADCSPGRNHFHLWSQHSQDQAFPAQKHSAHRWHLSHADEDPKRDPNGSPSTLATSRGGRGDRQTGASWVKRNGAATQRPRKRLQALRSTIR